MTLRQKAEGMHAESFPRQLAVSTAILTDGTVYYVALGAAAIRKPVTRVFVAVAAGGVGLITAKVGIFTADGRRVAVSADQGDAWSAPGMKEVPLLAPLLGPAGLYYVGLLAKAEGTLPAVVRGAASPVLSTAIAGGVRPFATQAGQADLPEQAVFEPGTFAPWAGIG